MAFSVDRYIDVLRRAEQDQSTVEGRLARLILLDRQWPYTASVATQQSRIDTVGTDTVLSRHVQKQAKGYDAATLKGIVQAFVDQAS